MGDHLLPDSKKEQVEEPPTDEPELIVKMLQEAGYSKTIDTSQFFERMWNEAQQSLQSSQKIPIWASGDPLHPSQPDPTRPCIVGSIAFQVRANEKDNPGPLDIPIGERRWYVVGYSERHSHEQKMLSKERTGILK